MRRLGTSLLVSAFVVVAIGCNTILENEPGRLDRGASLAPDRGSSSESSATEPIENENGNGRGEETPPGQPAPGQTTPDAGGCASGLKACGELCVSPEDPFYGCAGLTCARCDLANSTSACALGACGVASCTAGFADCNALPADGCETNLQTLNDCGGCGLKCPERKNVDMACVGGACTGTCAVGFADCNAKPEDGCERDLTSDKRNCGACGTRCAVGRCELGTCVWP